MAQVASCAEEGEDYPRAGAVAADSAASWADPERVEPLLAGSGVAEEVPAPVFSFRLCSFEGSRRFERVAQGRRCRPSGTAETGTTSGSRPWNCGCCSPCRVDCSGPEKMFYRN